MPSGKKTLVLVALIIFAGFLVRFLNIENAPPGVYPDEAVNGIDAINAMNGNWEWFYPANNGREGLFMNMIAVCFSLFGISVLSLKLPSILIGTSTIIGTYLLGKELFNKERVGIVAAFLVAFSFWAINFSRISFRANMLPAVLVFSFYFLWKGVRTKKWYDFAIGGLIFGIGLHTYISFRIAPLILVATLLAMMISKKGFLKEYWKSIAVFCAATAVTAAPMLYTFFISHPEYWQSRTSNVSIFNPEINQGRPVATFLKSLGLSVAKYNFWGDQNWRHNFPPYPVLDPVTGVAFTFGFAWAIIRIFHLLHLRAFRKTRHPQFEVYTFLLAWFFVMLIPEFMTAEGNPHALRSIGTLPPVFIFSALTFEFFMAKAHRHSEIYRKITYSMIALILISVGIFNVTRYHFVWAKKQETAQAFERNVMEASRYLHTLPESLEKFVVAESMQRIPIQVMNNDQPEIRYIYSSEVESIAPANEKNFIIILTDRNDEAISYLEEKYPSLSTEEKKGNLGTSFYVMKQK